MPQLSEPYVLGLLADLEIEVPAMGRQLEQAKKRAKAVDAELSNLVRRLESSKTALDEAQERGSTTASELTEKNMKIATLHQEIATIKKRSEDLKTEMDRVGPGAIYRRLRRERAKLSVRIEDRDAQVLKLRSEVTDLRGVLGQAEQVVETQRDRSRIIVGELDKLQDQLPSPQLYVGLFDRTAARAHCRMYVDRDLEPWAEQMRDAIALMTELHQELRAGKYRLDTNSEIIGGRAMATAEAIYGAAALGDSELALDLMQLATDPSLFFHQIFNIFRVWCLGLYLSKRRRELRELLRLHQFAPGLRGGYVETFIGLILDDNARVSRGLAAITKHEWEMWQDANLVRGAGVINLGAVALTRLALERGMAVHPPGPTVPGDIIAVVKRRKRVAGRRQARPREAR